MRYPVASETPLQVIRLAAPTSSRSLETETGADGLDSHVERTGITLPGMVRAFNGTLDWVAHLLPIPGMEGLMKLVKAILFSALKHFIQRVESGRASCTDLFGPEEKIP